MAADSPPAVLVAGETLIDFLPVRAGPLTDVSGFERRPGGAPANVAVGLATLGEPPSFWTRVGADPFGQYLARILTDHGLDDRFVVTDPAAKTTLAFVTHDEGGDRSFTFYRDGTADTRLEPGRIDDATLAECEWVHVGGVTLAAGRSRTATLDLLERAAGAGCTVSFDPNVRRELWPDEETLVSVCREALASVDVCKATMAELQALGVRGEDPLAVAREALALGPHTCFVTRGSDGAVVAADERAPWPDVPADRSRTPVTAAVDGYEVAVVDTTGAGDAFVAGVITALRESNSLTETLSFGCAVAAAATTDAGAMAALPTRDAVASIRD